MKKIIDLLYGTARAVEKYQSENPGDPVLVSDGCKAIVAQPDESITYQAKWISAKRAVVMLTAQKIVCGSWSIPLHQIDHAKLVYIKTMLGSGQVLQLFTKSGGQYQFGMQLNPAWTEQKALPLIVENGKITYSWFSLGIRLMLVGYLLWWVYERFIK